MAVAAAAAVAVDRKSVFRRALTALRYVVAGAVTVVVVMTAVYAFLVIARTDDLYINVVNSYISVDSQGTAPQKLSFTLSVYNPSGRVRFYYTGIHCVLNVNDTRNSTSTEEFEFPDMAVAPDSGLQIDKEANLSSNSAIQHLTNDRLIQDLKKNGSITFHANLTLTGNLTVGVYSAYNKTSVLTTYYCRYVFVGNISGPYSDTYGSTSCLTKEDIYIEEGNDVPESSSNIGGQSSHAHT